MQRRLLLCLLIVAACVVSWQGMLIVHEAGHVLAAPASGGRVVKVVLHPLAISRTDVEPNPHPLFVAWSGAAFGCLFPLAVLLILKRMKSPGRRFATFFAGFCLISGGAYLGSGYWFPAGDAHDLLALGTPRWALLLFGLVTIGGGLSLWHTLGPRFGLGADDAPPTPKPATTLMLIAVLIALVEAALSPRQ